MRAQISIALFTCIIACVLSSPPKQALADECTHNDLESGSYRCFMPDEAVSFLIHCMVDGTMYINAAQEGLYRYHKQNGLQMNFKLMLSADYHAFDDIDEDAIPQLPDAISAADDDSTLNDEDTDDDELESDELSSSEKESVNLTAQYIVYAVIILMALIFSIGICVLMYWWCCKNKMASDKATSYLDISEAQPFIDIRSQTTIKRKALMDTVGHRLHFGVNERNNVYDDIINQADDNESGDALIAHYGSTNNENVNDGYVIAKYP